MLFSHDSEEIKCAAFQGHTAWHGVKWHGVQKYICSEVIEITNLKIHICRNVEKIHFLRGGMIISNQREEECYEIFYQVFLDYFLLVTLSYDMFFKESVYLHLGG